MEDMPRKLPLHVVRERSRHGRVKFYYRPDKDSPRVRLPDDPSSAEFDTAYKAAVAGESASAKPPRDGPAIGLRWLVARYQESADWAGLAYGTRRARSNIFLNAIAKSQNMDFRDIDRLTMEESIDARRETPGQAGSFLKAMRGLFQWALRNGHVDADPTADVRPPRYESDGFLPWDMDDWVKFCGKWKIGTMPRKAAELLIYTGLRRSDVVRVGRQHMKGNILTIKTMKTGTTVSVELPQSLMNMLADTRGLHFITSSYDKPFTKESFGNWFRDRCNDAGITNKSAHGIRKLAATIAANDGATTHELMSQFGWSTTKQAETYTRGADRARLGVKSSRRIADQIANAVSPHPKSGAGIRAKSLAKSKAKK